MTPPEWARPLLWLVLAGVAAALVLRAIRRDRREYRRFKHYRATARRQAMLRRWLLESFVTFGGVAALGIVLAGGFAAPMLEQAQRWPWLRAMREGLGASPWLTSGAVAGVAVALVGVTMLGIAAVRREGEVPTVGDIHALLPRNRQELRLGALLSVNAGLVEELAFRLAIPALLFGASGSAIVAVAGSVLGFGLLHAYQGIPGIVGSTVLGAGFMLVFLLTGAIWVPIVLHALFDLRSLVLIPVAVYEVHRVDGRLTPWTSPLRRTAPPADQPSTR